MYFIDNLIISQDYYESTHSIQFKHIGKYLYKLLVVFVLR